MKKVFEKGKTAAVGNKRDSYDDSVRNAKIMQDFSRDLQKVKLRK